MTTCNIKGILRSAYLAAVTTSRSIRPNQAIIKPASSAQAVEARKHAFKEWGGSLTRKQYLEREHGVTTLQHAQQGRHTPWVLVPADKPETLEILSACETYEREIIVRPPNQTDISTNLVGYHLINVVTPKRFRGNGYASRMLGQLHLAIACLKQDGGRLFPDSGAHTKRPGIVSTLYSDIGRWYEGRPPSGVTGRDKGWVLTSDSTDVWLFKPSQDVLSPQVKLLRREDAAKTVQAGTDLFKKWFKAQEMSTRTEFAYLPTEAWCRFQMNQHDYHPEFANSPPEYWGVRTEYQGETHFITWTYDPGHKLMFTLNVRAIPESYKILLPALRSVCASLNYKGIESWSLDKKLCNTAQGLGEKLVKIAPLPGVIWYGEPGTTVSFLGDMK